MSAFNERPLKRFFLTSVAALASFSALQSCSDEAPSAPVLPTGSATVAAIVTPGLAASVGPDGRFLLSHNSSAAGRREISDAQATRLAALWVDDFGAKIRAYLENGHQEPIRFGELSPCGRAFYARSAFLPPSDAVPLPVSRPYGPYYFVTLCDRGGTSVISVAVSAWTTDLAIEDGHIKFAAFQGNEFFPLGIPRGHRGEYPASPEDAAVFVVGKSPRRVAQLPELIMPSRMEGLPQSARWQLTLDGEVTLVGHGGNRVTTRVAYVGTADPHVVGTHQAVPTATQPDKTPAAWIPPMSVGETRDQFSARLHTSVRGEMIARRPDTPVRFEDATSTGSH